MDCNPNSRSFVSPQEEATEIFICPDQTIPQKERNIGRQLNYIYIENVLEAFKTIICSQKTLDKLN